MRFNEEEIPKYKKKRDSSVSSSRDKSKHKHEYVNCLFVDKQKNVHIGIYCKICGKIDNIVIPNVVEEHNGHKIYRMMNNDEIYEKYKKLERIEIDDVYSQKYIPIVKQVN